MSREANGLVREDGLSYQTGFGNSFESECLEGALPKGRNNPRKVPYGLYAEQLSGTAFTSPRATNRRTWMYRIQPSVVGTHHPFQQPQHDKDNPKKEQPAYFGFSDSNNGPKVSLDPNPMRWFPMPTEESSVAQDDFVQGTKCLCQSGSPVSKSGLAIYTYAFGQDMVRRHMYNSDGDFLVVPQQGSLRIHTELGQLVVHPKEICVLPRGLVFSIHLYDPTNNTHNDTAPQEEEEKTPTTEAAAAAQQPRQGVARGYMLEVYKGHFTLPELGPIGSNGLANVRDFWTPTAWVGAARRADYHQPCTIVNKYGGALFGRSAPHTPYNVVAWHGNYVPFKYKLERFCAVNSVSYDHLDPSIYTVLTCKGDGEEGTALADFVIFPPRVMATDANTLRPPWFHRNTMTEFMGLVYGQYDAKEGGGNQRGGFQPGGASLHPCMTPHGPDAPSYDKAIQDACQEPTKLDAGLAFMFETNLQLYVTEYAQTCQHRDHDYAKCWSALQDTFEGWDLLLLSSHATHTHTTSSCREITTCCWTLDGHEHDAKDCSDS